eukprot:SAG31_NODE_5180_length_2695_cov_2.182203_1_plen_178_part_00
MMHCIDRHKLLLLEGVLLSSIGDVAGWTWRDDWSWQKIQTLTWGTNSSCCPYNGTNSHCCCIFENSDTVEFKTQFNVIFQDNDLDMLGCRVPSRGSQTGNFTPAPGSGGLDSLETCLAARSAAAGRLKAAAPNSAVLDYRGIVIAWWNYQTAAHQGWWLKGDSLEGGREEEVGQYSS